MFPEGWKWMMLTGLFVPGASLKDLGGMFFQIFTVGFKAINQALPR